jgi:hypothetical protein
VLNQERTRIAQKIIIDTINDTVTIDGLQLPYVNEVVTVTTNIDRSQYPTVTVHIPARCIETIWTEEPPC